jgi:hypothetical protein
VGLDQINQCFPRHNIFHLAQKSFSAGALFGSGLLVITESELLAAHEPSPYLRLLGYFRADGSSYPEPPQATHIVDWSLQLVILRGFQRYYCHSLGANSMIPIVFA